jgi:hypothetical protein
LICIKAHRCGLCLVTRTDSSPKVGELPMSGSSLIGLKGWATALFATLMLGFTAANSFSSGFVPSRAHAVPVSQGAGWPEVDRAHKGDRLGAIGTKMVPTPEPAPTIVRSAPAPHTPITTKSAPRLAEVCEPVASPYVDPQLAQVPGRCFG